MEQQMEQNRKARGKLNALGKMRAMELQMEHPQLMDNTQLETTQEMRGSGMGGGEAGMKRVIGAGKKTRKAMRGGAGMATLNDQLEGEGKCGGTNGVMSGGAKMGKDLGEQIMSLHGEGFFKDFLGGLTSVLKPIAGVASLIPGPIGTVGRIASGIMGGKKPRGRPRKVMGGAMAISAPPSGLQVSHAMMSPAQQGLPGQALGGQDVPPGGVAPIAYGNAPQAPVSFKRNAVGEGMPLLGRPGHGTLGAVKGSAVMKAPKMTIKEVKPQTSQVAMKGTGKRSARGQAISKLMKTKGMTLPQASKWLKEHPEGA